MHAVNSHDTNKFLFGLSSLTRYNVHMTQRSDFPDDFLWGASTASHQVEGNTHNQWTEWEFSHAETLARTAQKRLGWLPHWHDFKAQAENPKNYISGEGIAHYQLYEHDFALMTKLTMNAFRFGIEWSRVEPREGEWDQAAIEHYREYIRVLKAHNITPVVTLWHWTMPTWFTDKGAFAKRANLRYFDRYVQKVIELLGDEMRFVITLNEPNVYAGLSYQMGEWPPQIKSNATFMRVFYNLMLAHKRAYRIIKDARPELQVGVAAQLANMQAASPQNPVNRLVVAARAYAWNWWFLNRIQKHQDFIGLNYYFTEYIDWRGKMRNPKTPTSDLGWYMEPTGISRLLQQVGARYKQPIIITEDGLADHDDKQRQWWLQETIDALHDARQHGVNLQGYLHWSLLDNFEWAYGWWPEFGLIHVDRKTMQRTVRPSAQWFSEWLTRH